MKVEREAMSRLSTPLSLLVGTTLVLFSQKPVSATSTTLNFEGLPDGTIITNQYQGLTLSNAIILTAGITLNEFEFPPHSGSNVLSDNGGPITIEFSQPIQSFSGYFTYLEPLTIKAFNASNAQVASATSRFSNNMALSGVSGSSPDELIQVSNNSGISTLTISGDANGTSFALDDASFSPSTTTVPILSPTAFVLLSALLALVATTAVRRQALAISVFLAATTSLALIAELSLVRAQINKTIPSSKEAVHFSNLVVKQSTSNGPALISIRISHPATIRNSVNLISSVSGSPRLLARLKPLSPGHFSGPVPPSAAGKIQISLAVRGKVKRVLSQTLTY